MSLGISRTLIGTLNNDEYYTFENVPINKYSEIHTVLDCEPNIFNTCFVEKINNCVNLRFVSFDIKHYNKIKKLFNNQIAKFQSLSAVMFIDYIHTNFIFLDNQKYIYENKMILFNPSENDFIEIPLYIEHLNIVNENTYNYTNIPNNIRFLHLSIKNTKFQLTNLPHSLETLTITVLKYFKKYVIIEDIKNNIRLPFNCKLVVEYI